MAQMSPSVLADSVSVAEVKVYQAVRDLLPNEWIAIHSLRLNTHQWKLSAEIDFVLVTLKGILLFEVKGGTVFRDTAGWHFRNKFGKETIKAEGPFDQVRDNFFAVRDHFKRLDYGNLANLWMLGYGVILPECLFDIPKEDPELDPVMVLDVSGFPDGLPEYVRQLTDYWVHYRAAHAKSIPGSPMDQGARNDIYRLLVPEIRASAGWEVDAKQAEDRLIRLTSQQVQMLDLMEENERLLISGSAGTGKTVLAVEQARREVARGSKVLFVCFNRVLGEQLADQLHGLDGLTVGNYHQIVLGLVKQAGIDRPVAEEWDAFNHNLQAFVMDALDHIPSFQEYDYLIMDEGQDLMDEPFLNVLSLLLRNTLSQGRWAIFLDPAQAIFTGQYAPEALVGVADGAFRANLPINCRNTTQTAVYVRGLSGAGSIKLRTSANGPDVTIDYYSTIQEYRKLIRKIVNESVAGLAEVGINPCETAILSANHSAILSEWCDHGSFIRPVQGALCKQVNAVRVATIQSFKGLEASVVVLTGIDDLDDPVQRRLLYVGGSRARARLRMVLPLPCERQVQARIGDIANALAQMAHGGVREKI